MALGTRYIILAADPDGYRYRARILQEGASSATNLSSTTSRVQLFAGEEGEQDTNVPLVRSSLSVTVLRSSGALSAIFGAAPDAYPVVLERQPLSANPVADAYETIWRGYIHTRYYEDDPERPADTVVLKAHDGLELLKTRQYNPGVESESVIQTIHRILSGLGYSLPYRTLCRWYPHLENRITSRVLEKIYTRSAVWEDRRDEELRLSEYDVLKELVGRFQMQLVQSKGAFHLRQRANLRGAQAIQEVYNANGVFASTASGVDAVDATGFRSNSARPRSFLSQIRTAQSSHEHGPLEGLVEDGSFEASIPELPSTVIIGDWQVLRAGVSRVAIKDISEDAPTAENQFAAKITIGAQGDWQALRQGGLVLLGPNPKHSFRFAFDALRHDSDKVGERRQEGLFKVRASYDLSTPGSGFHLSRQVHFSVASPWLKGEDAPLHLTEGFGRHASGYVDGTEIIPPGATLWIYDQHSESFAASIKLTRPAKVGDRTLYGNINESFDRDRNGGPMGANQFLLHYHVWLPAQAEIRLFESAWDVETYFGQPIVLEDRFSHFEYEVRNVTPGGIPVEGFLEFTFGAHDDPPPTAGPGQADSSHYFAFDNIEAAIEDEDGRPVSRTIYAASTGPVLDETERLSYAFRTGDGPTKRIDARLEVVDGSGVRHQMTGGWKNGPYAVGEATTGYSIDALHSRMAVRQRRKHLSVRRLRFMFRNGEGIWPHDLVVRRGVYYTVGRWARSFGTGECEVELIEHYLGGEDGISGGFAQQGPQAATGGVGGTYVNVTGGGSGGAVEWGMVIGKPPLVNTFNSRDGDVTLEKEDVTGALGYDPDARFVNAAGDTMTGDLTMAAGRNVVLTGGGMLRGVSNGVHVFAADGTNYGDLVVRRLQIAGDTTVIQGEVVSISDNIILLNSNWTGVPTQNAGLEVEQGDEPNEFLEFDQGLKRWGQRRAGGTYQPFARTNVNEVISGAWIYTSTATFTPPPGAASKVFQFNAGYALYVDSAGAGPANNRLWLEAPDGGEVVVGPRSGNSELGQFRVRARTMRLETADYVDGVVSGYGSIYVDGGTFGTNGYVSRLVGAQINFTTGHADFRSLYADEIQAQAFTADVAQLLVGSEIISKSRATLAESFTVPAVGSTATLVVEDLEELGAMPVFEDGDTIRLRYISREGGGLIVADAWGTVASYVNSGNGTQSWTWTTRKLGPGVQGKVIHRGAVAYDYGTPGSGMIYSTVLDAAGSPYTQYQTWSDTDGDFVPDAYAVLARLGNLNGIGKTVAGRTVGGKGLYSTNVFLEGVIAVSRGYFGANGHTIVGDNLSGETQTGKVLVGNYNSGTLPIVKLAGPNTTSYVQMYYTSTSDWGLKGVINGNEYFKLSTTSHIGGIKFDNTAMWSGTKGSAQFQFNADGSGRLASGNISWNASGTVTFGSGVSLSWSQVSGRPTNLAGLDSAAASKLNGIEAGAQKNPSYITSTYIDRARIESPTINAGTINSAVLNSVTGNFTGTVTATTLNATQGGNLAGWTIGNNLLQKIVSPYVIQINAPTATSSLVFLVTNAQQGIHRWYVRADGFMYATNVQIVGTFSAFEGKLTMDVNGLIYRGGNTYYTYTPLRLMTNAYLEIDSITGLGPGNAPDGRARIWVDSLSGTERLLVSINGVTKVLAQ